MQHVKKHKYTSIIYFSPKYFMQKVRRELGHWIGLIRVLKHSEKKQCMQTKSKVVPWISASYYTVYFCTGKICYVTIA